VITHEQGHSETTSLSAGADDSGKKNNIQAIASTVSYLERYTFLAATGLTAKDMDDDAVSAEPLETISKDQIADLEALITETGSDKTAFMKYAKVDNLGEILAKNYKFAVQALEQKRKA
jgi:enoyl-[acyl-carrier-protein] reductase (NADH)